MPVELAYIYYLSFFTEWEMITVALTTATTAQIIDYYIGLSMSTAIVNNLVGEKRILNAEKHILKYGYLIILIFNLLPLSSPVISVAAGMLKFRFKDFIIYSSVGLIVKYIVLTLVF
jgi:membrane protein DedA with SNARE-associated domain